MIYPWVNAYVISSHAHAPVLSYKSNVSFSPFVGSIGYSRSFGGVIVNLAKPTRFGFNVSTSFMMLHLPDGYQSYLFTAEM